MQDGTLKWSPIRSEMTQNYRMVGERYPKPNKVVGGSIRAREIFSILIQEKVGSYASCVPQKEKEKRKKEKTKWSPVV